MSNNIANFFGSTHIILVHQIKELAEIIINWETANQYEILDSENKKIGFAAERTNGFFHRIVRNILRSHRPMTIDVMDNEGAPVLQGKRPFYFLFSNLYVFDSNNKQIGSVQTRFGFINRKYDLLDQMGNTFAKISSPRWRLWTFKIFNCAGEQKGIISKKWGGILKEAFTDADKFAIDLSQYSWSDHQKSIFLFATLSIDLDFFEDNSGSVTKIFN